MDNKQFLEQAKTKVMQWLNAYVVPVDADDVFVVWYAKTLQNHKALLGSAVSDHYFECTYNGDKHELYVDVYNKKYGILISCGDTLEQE